MNQPTHQTGYGTKMINETLRQTNQTAARPMKINVEGIAQLVPIALVVLLVNMLVLVVFLKTKKLRTSANYVLFSLAVNDFMTGALNIPLFIFVFFTPIISSNTVRFHLGFLLAAVHTVTAIISVYHIAIATLEKYLSIIRPITHRLINKPKVIKVLLMVWFVSTVIGLIPFTWINKTIPFTWVNKTNYPEGAKYFIGYIIFCFAVVFFFPYIFMLYAFVKMFRAIASGVGQSGTHETEERRKMKLARERKSIVLFVAMATAFSICWFPWFLLQLFYPLKFEPEALEVPAHVFTLVRYITSVINPLLYSLLRPDFNSALKDLFKGVGFSFSANCGSCHLRRDERQRTHAFREDHVCFTLSEHIQTLSNEPEE